MERLFHALAASGTGRAAPWKLASFRLATILRLCSIKCQSTIIAISRKIMDDRCLAPRMFGTHVPGYRRLQGLGEGEMDRQRLPIAAYCVTHPAKGALAGRFHDVPVAAYPAGRAKTRGLTARMPGIGPLLASTSLRPRNLDLRGVS
ncbi:hypothetical protein BV25DRAFT_1552227 [Artomyces pyxidatus]|uniref:Uncharacterized protein n=1 Tax=Artomyces pyxidatus TaxID=48021 RepID=A0ACB8SKC2_9AGAM|nr:hypothetical protein BV25DRAFT_1552227 [Artomyces pyxidatus]